MLRKGEPRKEQVEGGRTEERKSDAKLPMVGSKQTKKGLFAAFNAATTAVKNDRSKVQTTGKVRTANSGKANKQHFIDPWGPNTTGPELYDIASSSAYPTQPRAHSPAQDFNQRPIGGISIRTVDQLDQNRPQELEMMSSNIDRYQPGLPELKHDGDLSVVTADVQLKSIESWVLRAAMNSVELKGPKHESVEDAVIRIIQQYERISASLRDGKGRITTAEKIKQDMRKSEIELRNAKAQLSTLDTELRTRHRQETDHLKRKIDKLMYEKNEQISTHDAKLYNEQSSFQREKDDLKLVYERELSRAQDEALLQAKTIDELKVQMRQERKERSAEMNQFESDMRALQSQLVAEHSERESHMLQRIAELERQAQNESQVQQEFASKYEAYQRDLEKHSEERQRHDATRHEEMIRSLEYNIAEVNQKNEQELRAQKEQLTKKHGEEVLQLQTAIKTIQNKSAKEEEQFKKLLENEKADFERRMDGLLAELDQKKSQLNELEMHSRKERENVIRKLDRQHKTECNQQRTDATARLVREQHRYETIIREMKSNFEEFVELRKDVEQHRPKSMGAFNTSKVKLGDKHEDDILNVRSANADMKRVLTKGSGHSRGLKDHHIVGRFEAIAKEIEKFSRLEWDIGRETSWPCSESQLRQLHPQNTRKLKQYIVQSSLWTFLYERIFQSPFCMFGPEGSDMDRDWEDIYAPSNSPLKPPEVSTDIEEQRCANAKRCSVLIEPATEPSAEGAKLKASYEFVVAAAIETLSRLIENIASAGEQERNALGMIVRMCAKAWLECCAQQYRLMVRLGAPGGNVLALPSRATTHLWLVRTPELKRFGTLKGENLTLEEPVAGWKGAVYGYPS